MQRAGVTLVFALSLLGSLLFPEEGELVVGGNAASVEIGAAEFVFGGRVSQFSSPREPADGFFAVGIDVASQLIAGGQNGLRLSIVLFGVSLDFRKLVAIGGAVAIASDCGIGRQGDKKNQGEGTRFDVSNLAGKSHLHAASLLSVVFTRQA